MRRPAYEPTREELRARAAAERGAAAPATPHPAQQVLAMQRSAGNQATATLLRQPVQAPAKAPIPEKPASEVVLLPDDRRKIEAETHAEILTAFSAFLDACQSNQASLKAAAKAEAEMWALALDIATGFLAPAFATYTAERFIGRIAEKATKSMQVAKGSETVALIAKADFLKATFTGVSKVGTDQLKRKSTVLFGETDADLFLEQLKNEFQAGAVSLAGKVPGMTDDQLLSVWYAYDPELANVTAYKERLKTLLDQFAKYIRPISQSTEMDESDFYSRHTRVYWIDAYGRRRLVLVAGSDATNMWGTTEHRIFKAWVPPLWEDLAIRRTKAMFGSVTDIKGSQIQGHIPDPNR